jgi:ubiquitin-like 1-activating enzyme E1 A
MSTSDRQRTAAALPQIASLNPLVGLTAIPTLAPFVRDAGEANAAGAQEDITEFLRKEKVDVVVACDLTIAEMVGDLCCSSMSKTD